MVRKTLNVDEKTHRAITEVARKVGLNISSLLRLVFVSRIPLESLVGNTSTQAQGTQEVKEEEEIPVEEILDRALKEAEREEMEERERARREKEEEKPVRAEEKKEQEKPRRLVGDDHKKFFAEKFGIPYDPDEK